MTYSALKGLNYPKVRKIIENFLNETKDKNYTYSRGAELLVMNTGVSEDAIKGYGSDSIAYNLVESYLHSGVLTEVLLYIYNYDLLDSDDMDYLKSIFYANKIDPDISTDDSLVTLDGLRIPDNARARNKRKEYYEKNRNVGR